jgi:Transposase
MHGWILPGDIHVAIVKPESVHLLIPKSSPSSKTRTSVSLPISDLSTLSTEPLRDHASTYTPDAREFREEAVRLVRESGKSRVRMVKDLGISEQWFYTWLKQDELDRGKRTDGSATEEHAEVRGSDGGGNGTTWPRMRAGGTDQCSRGLSVASR